MVPDLAHTVTHAHAKNLKTISVVGYTDSTMYRCVVLFEAIIDDLMGAAAAMADGSYWREDDDGEPPPYGDNGNFFVGGGD